MVLILPYVLIKPERKLTILHDKFPIANQIYVKPNAYLVVLLELYGILEFPKSRSLVVSLWDEWIYL